MVKTVKIGDRDGYLLEKNDFERLEKTIYDNREIYFLPYKFQRTKYTKINEEELIQALRAGKSKNIISEETGVSISRINAFLQKKYKTASLREVQNLINK